MSTAMPVTVPARECAPGGTLEGPARRVEAHLAVFLRGRTEHWEREDFGLRALHDVLRDFVLTGGKRLRPAFCHWGHVGAGGDPDDPDAVTAGAGFELLHAFALLHDDVMDGSASRRGRPAAHVALAVEHAQCGWNGESRRFGEGLAVLLGDLAFAYADVLVRDLDPAARAVWTDLRVELTMGQYLDVTGAARRDRDLVRARRVARFKSGLYTVERPLHLGAALAGRLDDLAPTYTAYGRPLGEAFQLRDDLLGVFGDTATTGKPVGDDLREGKPTLLLALATRRCPVGGRPLLARVGRDDLRDDEIDDLRTLFEDCGARGAVEVAIERRVERALGVLRAAPIVDEARDALHELALAAAWRER
ncbi:MAG TPA: polyprenyl synthetase family protein [Acidimicrobiia bacterium]|nr:polyprenyl synthetase family protein [Acidimicrobiia bacterium]